MTRTGGLFLHEEILLLALRDREGTFHPRVSTQIGLSGAVIAELLLRERIRVDRSGKKPLVQAVDTSPLGDEVADECLRKIGEAGRRANLQTWVSRCSGIKQLRHRVARSLCDRGVLRADEDKVLLIFSRKIYPEIDPRPERALIERLRKTIFQEGTNLDPRTVVLLSLAKACGLLETLFDKKKLKARKDRIERIVNGELAGKATREAIEAMQAAVMVACIVPAIVTTTVTTH